MGFIDTHSHVIPFVDDGSENWEMSLEMLRQAEKDGIRKVVCTPHILSVNDFKREPEITQMFNELVLRANKENIDIELYLGSEIYVQPDIDMKRNIVTPAKNGRYFLIEFPMNMIPDFVAQRFFELVLDGYVPVVAHPERNGRIINEIDKAYDFVKQGAILQMNAGSLLGTFGSVVQQVAFKLLDANLIHLIGSDAHDIKMRPLKLRSAFEMVSNRWGNDRARKLFIETPQMILAGKPIIVDEPIRFEQMIKESFVKKWFSRFKK